MRSPVINRYRRLKSDNNIRMIIARKFYDIEAKFDNVRIASPVARLLRVLYQAPRSFNIFALVIVSPPSAINDVG